MFSKQEAAQLRKEFWTVFGQYMSPIPSSEGEKINWINYRTGVKGLQFKMDVNSNGSSIAIELILTDAEKQKFFFEQLIQQKNIFQNILQEEWTWRLHTYGENGKMVSKVYKEKKGGNILKREDWPSLISFFKLRIMKLDEFWNSVKYGFEGWQ
jgi:hypothetical protein